MTGGDVDIHTERRTATAAQLRGFVERPAGLSAEGIELVAEDNAAPVQ